MYTSIQLQRKGGRFAIRIDFAGKQAADPHGNWPSEKTGRYSWPYASGSCRFAEPKTLNISNIPVACAQHL